MDFVYEIFGAGPNLNVLQMTARTIVIFFFALLCIRISGRRSFGLYAPIDNIILILLGSVLGRALVGASPFWPTVIACLVITLLHRIIGRFSSKHLFFDRYFKGEKILLFEKDHILKENLPRSLVSEEDIHEAVRLTLNKEGLEEVEKAYIERNGRISLIKKRKRDGKNHSYI